ncbi:MAG: hypothetical protein LBF00_02665 [Mycoplasmataceae bacterium]|nr:hypothetical protein [Mycoplasmataceae bacterium]
MQAIPNHREPLDNDHDTTKTPTPRGMPQWFKTWSETQFEPLKSDVKDVKTRVTNLETRLDNVENVLNRNILK